MKTVLRWTLKSLGSNDETERGEASIGFVVPKADRDQFFRKDECITAHLLSPSGVVTLQHTPPPSFWDETIEFTSKPIRAWVDEIFGLKNWSSKKRPKVLVWPVSQHVFAVLGLEETSVES